MHRQVLLSLLSKYQPIDDLDANHLQQIGEFIKSNSDCFERSNQAGHITGSCWLVNASEDCVALTFHRKLTKWLQPGGHADGESEVLQVALREAQEETGLASLEIVSNEIFDLDVHLIPARANEPEHYHFDIRFAFKVPDTHDHKLLISDESVALAWCPLSQFELMGAEESLLRMKRKWLKHLRLDTDILKRSYQSDIVERLHRLRESSGLKLEPYGNVENSKTPYQLYRLVSSSINPSLPRVLLTAGIHGDEPAGIIAALTFAEQKLKIYADEFNFTIYPCLNPSGFDLDTRHNARGIDLNRDCHHQSEEAEIKCALQSLEKDSQQYILSIDLHEDNPFIRDGCFAGVEVPHEFYL